MNITELVNINSSNIKLVKKVDVLEILLAELRKKEISNTVVNLINIELEKINYFFDSERAYSKVLRKSQSNILKIIEQKSGLFVKKHHQQKWMAVGAGLGVAMGTAFGTSQDNMGLMALGIPIGVGIGISIGKKKDDEVFKLGNQLDVEIEI